jgi:uncharacterized protein (TIGR02266 family)
LAQPPQSSDNAFLEKRQTRRVALILRVDYPDRRHCLDATENLSGEGLFIQTDQTFEVGQPVPLSLSFPGLMDPLEIIGRVMWVRKQAGDECAGIGVRVDREVYRQRLAKLLSVGPTETIRTSPAPAPVEGYRILIVEDNPHLIEMYTYVLKKLATGTLGGKVPIEVHFAPEGHSALQQLMSARFSLLLTDLYMPVMDGFALIEKIRREEALKTLPIIAISAGGRDAQEQAAQLGVDIFLRKPVKFVEVLETVKRLLNLR